MTLTDLTPLDLANIEALTREHGAISSTIVRMLIAEIRRLQSGTGPAGEVRFVQIATSADPDDIFLYGLTKDGSVYVFDTYNSGPYWERLNMRTRHEEPATPTGVITGEDVAAGRARPER